jgi:hypothetical protein
MWESRLLPFNNVFSADTSPLNSPLTVCTYHTPVVVVHRERTVVATQPPKRPNPSPNREAIHTTSPLAKTQNTTLESDHAAVVPTVPTNMSSPRTAPMKPARRPAALGFDEQTAAMTPAMNAPHIILPPPMVASEFGSQSRIAVTGSEAPTPMSANCHGSARVWTRSEDSISSCYVSNIISVHRSNMRVQ